MYRSVFELTRNELDELKNDLFWHLEEEEENEGLFDCPKDIPDSYVQSYYVGISFVEEDFFCNLK